MRIWYLSKYAQRPLFGTPTRQYFYSKYFAKKGFDVTLVSSRSNGNKSFPRIGYKNMRMDKYERVKLILLNGSIINLGFNYKRIISWVLFELRVLYWGIFQSKEKPDVVIASSLSLLTFISGVFFKKYYKCKLICEVRDIWPLTVVETKKLSKKNLFIRFLTYVEHLGYKHADIIVGSMGNLAEYIKSVNPDYSNKVKYIPTGFDPEFYKKDDTLLADFNKKFQQIATDNFIVGYAGSIGKANCIDQIIDVAYLMRNDHVSFVLIGDGVLKNDYLKRIEELNLHNIHFLGYCPKKTLPFILNKCDILINPWLSGVNIYKYGLSPNKWIDYMYSGRPIIVSVDGYQNIINEAECGMFVKAGDIKAIVDAINYYRGLSKIQLDEIGQNGKNYLLNNLTYSELAKKYLDILR